MLCIGYAKSVPDEGFRSIDRPEPLTRLRGVYHRAALRAERSRSPHYRLIGPTHRRAAGGGDVTHLASTTAFRAFLHDGFVPW